MRTNCCIIILTDGYEAIVRYKRSASFFNFAKDEKYLSENELK